jgi:hypothetical protein
MPQQPAPSLAAVKHAQQQDSRLAQSLCSRPSSRSELYAYYKSMGMQEVFFALFPGP